MTRIQRDNADELEPAEELELKQALLGSVLGIATDAIITIDEKHCIRIFSKGAELIFGYSAAEVLGKPVDILLPLRFGRSHREHVKEFADRSESSRLMHGRREIIGLRKDGTEFPAEASIAKLETGKAKAFTVLLRDITEHKKVEMALRQSEERFRRSVVDAPIPVIMHADDGEVLIISKKWTELSGYSLADIPTIFDWTEKAYGGDRQHRDRQRELIDSLYDIEESDEHEALITTASGEKRLWEVRDAPLGRLADGRRYVISMVVDVTERKQAENAVQESEERFRDFAEGASDWFWEMDADLRFTYHSERYFEITGFRPEDKIGTTRTRYVNSKDLEVDANKWTAHLVDIEAQKPFNNFEYSFIARDGRVLYVGISGTPVFDPEGRFLGYRGTGTDITERKHAEEEIHELNEDLERRVEERTVELRAAQDTLLRNERLSTLGQLTATVSHELRNPLGVIRASAFIVQDGLNGATPRIQRALERIERNIIRCDRIIDELLDFTRISEIKAEPTPIDAWLDETLKEQGVPPGVALRRDFAMGDRTVSLDRDRFRRAIINVFDNACQAMIQEGTEDASTDECVLTVRTREQNGRVEIIFEDTGPGIPPDVYGRIFEPLFSTKGFGVGLGLSVVKQIMEQHGGGIEIESEEGRGTRVCLWLLHDPSTH